MGLGPLITHCCVKKRTGTFLEAVEEVAEDFMEALVP